MYSSSHQAKYMNRINISFIYLLSLWRLDDGWYEQAPEINGSTVAKKDVIGLKAPHIFNITNIEEKPSQKLK